MITRIKAPLIAGCIIFIIIMIIALISGARLATAIVRGIVGGCLVSIEWLLFDILRQSAIMSTSKNTDAVMQRGKNIAKKLDTASKIGSRSGLDQDIASVIDGNLPSDPEELAKIVKTLMEEDKG